jgi:hypothetical protein
MVQYCMHTVFYSMHARRLYIVYVPWTVVILCICFLSFFRNLFGLAVPELLKEKSSYLFWVGVSVSMRDVLMNVFWSLRAISLLWIFKSIVLFFLELVDPFLSWRWRPERALFSSKGPQQNYFNVRNLILVFYVVCCLYCINLSNIGLS